MAEVILVGDVASDTLGEELGLDAGPIVILKCTPEEARLFGPLLYQQLAVGSLYVPYQPAQPGGPISVFAGLSLKTRKEENP